MMNTRILLLLCCICGLTAVPHAQSCLVQTLRPTAYTQPCDTCPLSAIFTVPLTATWDLRTVSAAIWNPPGSSGQPYILALDGPETIARSILPFTAEPGSVYDVSWGQGMIPSMIPSHTMDGPLPQRVTLTGNQSLIVSATGASGRVLHATVIAKVCQ